MDFHSFFAQLSKDLDWFSFYARYCAGRNLTSSFCRDFEWWMLGAAALIVIILVWWGVGRLLRSRRAWQYRRDLARVADEKTMRQHVWSGYDSPQSMPSTERRASRDTTL